MLDDVDICDIGVDSIVVNGHAERLAVFQSEVKTISEVRKGEAVKIGSPKKETSKNHNSKDCDIQNIGSTLKGAVGVKIQHSKINCKIPGVIVLGKKFLDQYPVKWVKTENNMK